MASAAPASDHKYTEFLKLQKPSGPSTKVTIALFGLGFAGTIHFKNLSTNHRVHLKYVIEDRAHRRKEIEDHIGPNSGIQFVGVDKIDSVLKDESLEAVVITTPTFTHKDLILKSLEQGKAVLCEKPISEKYEDVKMCYDKAAKTGRPLLCSFNRRFDPSFRNVVDRVHAGELGKLHVIKSVARNSPKLPYEFIKASGGIFRDTTIHDIDLIIWAVGEFPTRVFATGVAHMPEIAKLNDYDTCMVQLSFPGGCIGISDFSRFAVYGYDQRLEVFGPGGMLQCDNQTTLDVKTFKSEGILDQPIFYSFPSRYDASYKNALEHFINVVEGKEKPLVTAQEALAVCAIAEAADKSARTGQPVDIKYN